MILEETDALDRINSENNLINRLRVKILPHGGRKEGQIAIPEPVRHLLGSLANESEESQAQIAELFGVSQVTVSDAKRGLVGDRYDEDLDESNEKVTKKTADDAHEAALDCLMDTLSGLSGKIKTESSTLKAKDLSKIATDMSRVMGSLKPAEKSGDNINNTQVIVYQPVQRKEAQYEVIDA